MYLVDNSDRDHSEGPEKSTVEDRNDGSRKCKSPGSNHPPFSTLYFDKSAYYRYSAISDTTTDTLLSLMITEHTLYRTLEKTFYVKN